VGFDKESGPQNGAVLGFWGEILISKTASCGLLGIKWSPKRCRVGLLGGKWFPKRRRLGLLFGESGPQTTSF
jgi:hypothetical protein